MNGVPTFLTLEQDALLVVKFLHHGAKKKLYAYVLYILILRCFVYTSKWKDNGFKSKGNRTQDAEGNPIAVHVW